MPKSGQNRIFAFAKAAGLCLAVTGIAGCSDAPTDGIVTSEAVIYPLNCVVVDINPGDFYKRATYDFNRGVSRFEPFVHSPGGTNVLQDPFEVAIKDIPEGWGRVRAKEMFEMIPKPNGCAVPKFKD